MATNYHYEALRRQRIIDRAAEARKRVEESQPEGKEEITAEKNKHTKRKRHKKSHKTVSGDHHHKKQVETSFPGTSKRQTSRKKVESLETPEVSVKSQEGSRLCSVEGSIHSIPTTSHNSEVTRQFSNKQSRVSTAASENTTMASSTKSRRTSASNSMTSYFSTPSTAQLKADAIRRDLERQERILHDSNLVMGTIDMEEETKLQQKEGGIE